MYSFFVLGIIPGTNLQITFQIWFDTILLLIEIAGIIWLYRRHRSTFSAYIPASLAMIGRCYYLACLNELTQLRAFFLSQTATWE